MTGAGNVLAGEARSIDAVGIRAAAGSGAITIGTAAFVVAGDIASADHAAVDAAAIDAGISIPAAILTTLLRFVTAHVVGRAAGIAFDRYADFAAFRRAGTTWPGGSVATNLIGLAAAHEHIQAVGDFTANGRHVAAVAGVAMEAVSTGIAVASGDALTLRTGLADIALDVPVFADPGAADTGGAQIVGATSPFIGWRADATDSGVALIAIAAVAAVVRALDGETARAGTVDADSALDAGVRVATRSVGCGNAAIVAAGLAGTAGITAFEHGAAFCGDDAAFALTGRLGNAAADACGPAPSAGLRRGADAAVVNRAAIVGEGAAIEAGCGTRGRWLAYATIADAGETGSAVSIRAALADWETDAIADQLTGGAAELFAITGAETARVVTALRMGG